MRKITMKLASALPEPVVRLALVLRTHALALRNRKRPNSAIFSETYGSKTWGGDEGFFSGQGSRAGHIVEPYVAVLGHELRERFGGKATVVDLGCGDFAVGSRLTPHCRSYVGVDVVPELVQRLQDRHRSERVRFEVADITRDPLPRGDVCLIRQVFQHLSNQEILSVLIRLGGFKAVYVTEHLPIPERLSKPNLEKAHGPDIRLWRNSGVYLDQPPFGLPTAALSTVLEVPGSVPFARLHPGVVRTTRYEPTGGAPS